MKELTEEHNLYQYSAWVISSGFGYYIPAIGISRILRDFPEFKEIFYER